jgi:hypothetical protein
MVAWVCNRCKFRFNATNPRDCPYCGRETLEKEKNASELLDEVDDLLNSE